MQQSQFVHGNSCNSQRFVHGNSCNTAVLQNSETHEIVAEIYKSWYCLKILQLVHATVEVFYNSCFSCRTEFCSCSSGDSRWIVPLMRQSQNFATYATIAACWYSKIQPILKIHQLTELFSLFLKQQKRRSLPHVVVQYGHRCGTEKIDEHFI